MTTPPPNPVSAPRKPANSEPAQTSDVISSVFMKVGRTRRVRVRHTACADYGDFRSLSDIPKTSSCGG